MSRSAGTTFAEQRAAEPAPRRRNVRALVLLFALCTIPVAIEEAILVATGFRSARPLAPQVTAPQALGIFHDLRWMLVYHDSWPMFLGEFVLALLLRSALIAAIAQVCWPAEAQRPSFRESLRRSAGFTAICMICLSPWAIVAMAASETSLSWFTFGELLPVIFLTVMVASGGIRRRWWCGLPPLTVVGWTLLSLLVSSLGGAAISSVSGWWTVAVAACFGAFNALLWRAIVRSIVIRRSLWPRAWVVPSAFVVTLAALLVLSVFSSLGAGPAGANRWVPALVAAQRQIPDHTILFVAGYNSSYGGNRDVTSVPVHFSYRGLGADGSPLAYHAKDTHQSLFASAALLAEQVQAVANRDHHPVTIVAQSEGTLVTRAYLGAFAHREVDTVVFTSPLVRPGRAYFPPPSESSGWGYVAGWELRGMLHVMRLIGPYDEHADEPFVRSIVEHAPFFRDSMLCAVPGVRMIAFVPTAAAAVVPPNLDSQIPLVELPGVHGTLLQRPGFDRLLVAFIRGELTDGDRSALFSLLQRVAAGWQAPALALSVNPVWHAAGIPDAAFDLHVCGPAS
ncbi:hypothetical protein FOS14_14655 [Skermania sp. ID1734]|uniref:hypothetical protein n=1 Tax=Skermania sp. ID1734 TaxID=2597516 RepID=UPI00117BF013|nr:hypothetical protein [Skermania sp. ID1734]TSD97227.1 hypothetical protein FOS14_14655 [Skermania sp. ID1734]